MKVIVGGSGNVRTECLLVTAAREDRLTNLTLVAEEILIAIPRVTQEK